MMLFLHLFMDPANAELCKNFVFIDGKPLVNFLTRAAGPVPFYLFLSGYGLYKVYLKGDKNRWNRLIKLCIHYWLILLIFVPLAYYVKPTKIPLSTDIIIANIFAYDPTYDAPMWFFLPYIILAIISIWIFKVIDKHNSLIIIFLTLIIHIFTSYCISRYGQSYIYNARYAYNLLLVFHFLFQFCLGAICAKDRIFERSKDFCKKIIPQSFPRYFIISILLIGLIFYELLGKYNFFYAFGVIWCISNLNIRGWSKAMLVKLGDQSMNMWMIHYWFYQTLLHDFVYSFKFPLLVLGVLTIISYAASIIINKIATPVERLIMPVKIIKQPPII